MKKFLLFTLGLVALLILIANLGPMVLLGVSIWLLYVIFKKFVRSNSVGGKIGWTIVGLLVLSIAFSNIYAVIGVAAAYALYVIVKSWKNEENEIIDVVEEDDPFTNFEQQWAELNR